MRILMFVAVVCLIVGLVCSLVPTQALGQDRITWLIAGLLFWAVDVLLGGWLVALPARREQS